MSVNRGVFVYLNEAELSASLERARKNASRLTNQMDQIADKANPEFQRLEAQLQKTNTKIGDMSKQLNGQLGPSLKQIQGLVGKAWNELASIPVGTPEWNRKMNEFKKLNTEFIKIKEQVGGVGKAFESFGSKVKTVAAGLFLGNIAADALQAVTSFATSVLKFNTELQSSVKNLSAITGATGNDLQFLKNAAVELSMTGSSSAVEYVEAMKLIGSAKPELLSNKEGLIEVTQAAKLLAQASGLDLPEASKRLTDAMNQFAVPADRAAEVVDRLAAASKFGAAEVPEVTAALLEFGTQANSSNVSIGESAALIELLAEKGIKGAEAGTKLRNVLLALNAVDALDAKALASLEEAGVNTQILSDKSLSLEQRLTELSKVSDNATSLVRIFGKENFNAAQIVLTNIGRYSELNEQIKETGVAAQQAATNTATFATSWANLKNVLNNLFVNLPIDRLSGLVKGFSDLVTFIGKSTGLIKSNVQVLQDEQAELLRTEMRIRGYDEGQEERIAIINQLKAKYPQLLADLDAERASNEEIAVAIRKVNSSLVSKIALANLAEKYEGAAEDRAKAANKLAEAKLDLEKELSYLMNSRSTMANKANKQATEGLQTEAAVNAILTGRIKLQEVAGVSLVELREYWEKHGKAVMANNAANKEYNDILSQQAIEEQKLMKILGIEDGGAAPATTKAPNVVSDTAVKKEATTKGELYAKAMLAGAQAGLDIQATTYGNILMGINTQFDIAALQFKEQLAQNLIDEEEYTGRIENLEILRAQAKLTAAKVQAGVVKEAAKDVGDFQIDYDKKVFDARIRTTKALEGATQQTVEKVKVNMQELNSIIQASGQVLQNILGAVFDGIAQKDENNIAAFRVNQQEKQTLLQRQLDAQLITQEEYNRESQKLEIESRIKERKAKQEAFLRDKSARIASAIMNTALAVTAALTSVPFNPLNAFIAGATGLAQVGIIAAQKMPSFGKGGTLPGNTYHSDSTGGLYVYDPRSKQVVATVESDEEVTNRRSSKKYRSLLKAVNADDPAAISNWFKSQPQFTMAKYQEATGRSRSTTGDVFFDSEGISSAVQQNTRDRAYATRYMVNGIVTGIANVQFSKSRKL